MAPRPKNSRFTAQLPATPCTAELRDQIEQIAKNEDKSVAAISREAYALFLSRNVRKANKPESNANRTKQQPNHISTAEG